jgi:ubiquinol-cytochrome c reductase cytochrome b subunit
VVFYGVCWAEGANDVIAYNLHIPLYTITWIARVLVFVGPVAAFFITKRICLALQRQDKETLLHGYESGIIRQLPNGEFIEVHRQVDAEARAVLEAKTVPALLPAPGSEDENGVPAPSSRGALGKARARANRAFAETIVVETNGHHGNGHEGGNGHGSAVEAGEAGEQASVGSAAAGELPAGENPEDSSDS